MTSRKRPHPLEGTLRPYRPDPTVTNPQEQAVEALDHIAQALSAMDTNLQVLTKNVKEIAKKMGATDI